MEILSIVPPFGSPGGKFNVRKQIVNCLPEHRVYCEPYAGSLAVLYAKQMSPVEVASDLDEEIYFAHSFIKNITQEQITDLRKRNWISTKRHFLKLHDERPTKDLDRIYRFLYMKHASYDLRPSDITTFSPNHEGENVGACLDRLELCALRLNNVEILNQEAIDVIEKYDNKDAIFYIDPPYEKDWEETQDINVFDVNKLLDCLKSLKGKFLLSYKNAEGARELFKDFEIRKLQVRRTMKTGEAKPYKDYELLIANYELPKRITKAVIDDFVGLLRLPDSLKDDFDDYISSHNIYDRDSGELADLPEAELQRLYTNWINELKDKKRAFFISFDNNDDNVEKGIRQLFGMPGGKKRLSQVLAKIVSEQEHKTYVENFAGGAAVFFAKEPSEKEVLADINEDIIFAYKFAQDLTDEQLAELKKMKWTADEDYFYELRDKERPKDPVERFYWWMYITKFSYGTKGGHIRSEANFDTGSITFNTGGGRGHSYVVDSLPRIKERLQNVIIERADYRDTIKKYDNKDAIFYCDPPYFGEEVDGTKIDNLEFYEAIKKIKGKWLVSLNDLPENRDAFKDYNICTVYIGRRFDSGGEKGVMRDKELLIANFELPEKIIKVAGEKLETGESELTREEQRELLESEIGDHYIVVENGKKHRFVIQYHVRGIWSKADVKRVREGLKEAKTQDDLEVIWHENNCAYLKTSLDELSKEAQKVDDDRGDVSAIVKKHLSTETPKIGEFDLDKVYNLGNTHVDFRNEEPEGRYLIGWTCDVTKVVLQDLNDELHFILRDRILQNEDGDNWLSQRKNPQPIAYLHLVSPKKPIWEAEPQQVGATKETSGRFIFKASGRVIFANQKTDFHEMFYFFDQDEDKHLDGRFDWKLIPSRKEYTKAPEKAFWMGSRPWKTQTPYILTHDREVEEAKAKKDKIEMVWNEKTIDVLRELKYEHLDEIEKATRIEFEMPIIKVLADKQIAIGPLLVPNRVDAQNDFATPEDIEDAAHKCLEFGPDIKLMHEGKPIDAVAVESAIFRQYANLPEGTWIGAVKIRDKAIWNKIKSGELRGFSIGGTGARQKVKIKR